MTSTEPHSSGSTNGDAGEAQIPPGRGMSRWIAILVILGVIAVAAYYFSTVDHSPEPQQAKAASGPIEAAVITLKAHDVPYESEFLGQSEPSETVQIRARVSGFLLERGFKDGDHVEEGQVLFRLDPEPFQVELDQAEAGLLAAEANLTRANQQLKRYESLAKVQQAATNELEQVQEAQHVASAAVQTQKALIAKAKLDLLYASIVSPISGVIGERLQDVGSFVGPAADPLLATVRKVDPLDVRFTLSEKDFLRWQRLSEDKQVTNIPIEDVTVKVILPDGREFPHLGTIDYIDVAIDPSTATAVVRAKLPNPDQSLRPGQFVKVELSGNRLLDVLTVPQNAVMQDPSGATVYVLDEGGRAQIRRVELGDWSGSDWMILSGLSAGEKVIIDHLMKIRPGTEIRMTDQKADANPPAVEKGSGPDDRPAQED